METTSVDSKKKSCKKIISMKTTRNRTNVAEVNSKIVISSHAKNKVTTTFSECGRSLKVKLNDDSSSSGKSDSSQFLRRDHKHRRNDSVFLKLIHENMKASLMTNTETQEEDTDFNFDSFDDFIIVDEVEDEYEVEESNTDVGNLLETCVDSKVTNEVQSTNENGSQHQHSKLLMDACGEPKITSQQSKLSIDVCKEFKSNSKQSKLSKGVCEESKTTSKASKLSMDDDLCDESESPSKQSILSLDVDEDSKNTSEQSKLSTNICEESKCMSQHSKSATVGDEESKNTSKLSKLLMDDVCEESESPSKQSKLSTELCEKSKSNSSQSTLSLDVVEESKSTSLLDSNKKIIDPNDEKKAGQSKQNLNILDNFDINDEGNEFYIEVKNLSEVKNNIKLTAKVISKEECKTEYELEKISQAAVEIKDLDKDFTKPSKSVFSPSKKKESLSEHVCRIPGLSFIIGIKPDEPSNFKKNRYDCVLCGNEKENLDGLFTGSEMKSHAQSRRHVLNVMRIMNDDLYQKYTRDNESWITTIKLLDEILKYEAMQEKQKIVVATMKTYAQQRESVNLKIKKLNLKRNEKMDYAASEKISANQEEAISTATHAKESTTIHPKLVASPISSEDELSPKTLPTNNEHAKNEKKDEVMPINKEELDPSAVTCLKESSPIQEMVITSPISSDDDLQIKKLKLTVSENSENKENGSEKETSLPESNIWQNFDKVIIIADRRYMTFLKRLKNPNVTLNFFDGELQIENFMKKCNKSIIENTLYLFVLGFHFITDKLPWAECKGLKCHTPVNAIVINSKYTSHKFCRTLAKNNINIDNLVLKVSTDVDRIKMLLPSGSNIAILPPVPLSIIPVKMKHKNVHDLYASCPEIIIPSSKEDTSISKYYPLFMEKFSALSVSSLTSCCEKMQSFVFIPPSESYTILEVKTYNSNWERTINTWVEVVDGIVNVVSKNSETPNLPIKENEELMNKKSLPSVVTSAKASTPVQEKTIASAVTSDISSLPSVDNDENSRTKKVLSTTNVCVNFEKITFDIIDEKLKLHGFNQVKLYLDKMQDEMCKNRKQSHVVIVTDERENFDVTFQGFNKKVDILKVPGIQFDSALNGIKLHYNFGRGTIFIFSCGTYDLLQRYSLKECTEFQCPCPPDMFSLKSFKYSSNYLISKALKLNIDILTSTENDIALFCGLLPVRLNQYNKYVLYKRPCYSKHPLVDIPQTDPIKYDEYQDAVTSFNKFSKCHAKGLGFEPWQLEAPYLDKTKQVILTNGFNVSPSDDIERTKKAKSLCYMLMLSFSKKCQLNSDVQDAIQKSIEVTGEIQNTVDEKPKIVKRKQNCLKYPIAQLQNVIILHHQIFISKIEQKQKCRTQKNIVIVTDERDNFDHYLADFNARVSILKMPAMNFESVIESIRVHPQFGKGTVFVFSGGTHDLHVSMPFPDCLNSYCSTPQIIMSNSHPFFDSHHLVNKALELHMEILNSTSDDIALFCGLAPIVQHRYNLYVVHHRPCWSFHPARYPDDAIVGNYDEIINYYNSFTKYHAEFLGYTPWDLEVSFFNKPAQSILMPNCYNFHYEEEVRRVNEVKSLSTDLISALSSNVMIDQSVERVCDQPKNEFGINQGEVRKQDESRTVSYSHFDNIAACKDSLVNEVFFLGRRDSISLLSGCNINSKLIYYSFNSERDLVVSRVLNKIGRIPEKSVCCLVFDLSFITKTVESVQCHKNSCEEPLLISALKYSTSNSEEVRNLVFNELRCIEKFVKELSLHIPVLIFPLAPMRIFCEDKDFQRHRIGHTVNSMGFTVVDGSRSLWLNTLQYINSSWIKLLKASNRKFDGANYMSNFAENNVDIFSIFDFVSDFLTDWKEQLHWKSFLNSFLLCIAREKSIFLKSDNVKSSNCNRKSSPRSSTLVRSRSKSITYRRQSSSKSWLGDGKSRSRSSLHSRRVEIESSKYNNRIRSDSGHDISRLKSHQRLRPLKNSSSSRSRSLSYRRSRSLNPRRSRSLSRRRSRSLSRRRSRSLSRRRSRSLSRRRSRSLSHRRSRSLSRRRSSALGHRSVKRLNSTSRKRISRSPSRNKNSISKNEDRSKSNSYYRRAAQNNQNVKKSRVNSQSFRSRSKSYGSRSRSASPPIKKFKVVSSDRHRLTESDNLTSGIHSRSRSKSLSIKSESCKIQSNAKSRPYHEIRLSVERYASRKRSHSKSSSPMSKRPRAVQQPSSFPTKVTLTSPGSTEDELRKKIELSEVYVSKLQEMQLKFDDEFEVFRAVPEFHPNFEQYYERFASKYSVQVENKDEQYKDKLWKVFWKSNIDTFKKEEWQTRRQKFLEEFETTDAFLPSSPNAHKKEIEQNSLFSFDAALSLLEKLSDDIVYLGPSIISMINIARSLGTTTKGAYDVFADSGNVAILNFVQDKFKSLSKASEGERFHMYKKAIEWIPKLIEEAERGPTHAQSQLTVDDIPIDLNAIAKISLGKSTEFTIDLIQTALAYEGIDDPSTQLINDLFMKVCAIHFKLKSD